MLSKIYFKDIFLANISEPKVPCSQKGLVNLFLLDRSIFRCFNDFWGKNGSAQILRLGPLWGKCGDVFLLVRPVSISSFGAVWSMSLPITTRWNSKERHWEMVAHPLCDQRHPRGVRWGRYWPKGRHKEFFFIICIIFFIFLSIFILFLGSHASSGRRGWRAGSTSILCSCVDHNYTFYI